MQAPLQVCRASPRASPPIPGVKVIAQVYQAQFAVALSGVTTGSGSASPSLSQLPTGGGTVGPRQPSTTTLQLQVVPSSAGDAAPAPYVPPPPNPVAANPGLYTGAVGLRAREPVVAPQKPKGRKQPGPGRDSSFRFSTGMWARLPGQRRPEVRDTLAAMESLLSSPGPSPLVDPQAELCRQCGTGPATVFLMHGATGTGCRCLCEGCRASNPPRFCLQCGALVTDMVSTATGSRRE